MKTNRETTLEVFGMTCPSCVGHVNEALRDLQGVSDVEVRMSDGKVLVRHDAGLPVERLLEALRDAGYEPQAAA